MSARNGSAAGRVPGSVRTNARVHRRSVDGAPMPARLDIDAEGHASGVDEQQFQGDADEAKATCPVVRALAGIPEIVLIARLVGGV
jgi:lipoyl-dependent peroxiredoxin